MRPHLLLAVSSFVCLAGPARAFDDFEVEPPRAVNEPLDSDGDGIPDEIEILTGTDPIDADSDGDGVPDGVEDANRDGRVDPGETDPRRAGLFPGSNPHIPEPMYFDLVRGLGARKGELEVNALFALSRPRGGRPTLQWAPEVEWAVVDNFAVELELPMVDRHVEAYKAALQWTAPQLGPSVAHGFQVLGEYLIDDRVTELSALYLAGFRTGRVSWFAMAGPRIEVGQGLIVAGQINPSVFYDADEAVTFGLEGNVSFAKAQSVDMRALAQVHWQVSHKVRIQAGGGVTTAPGGAIPVGVARIILE